MLLILVSAAMEDSSINGIVRDWIEEHVTHPEKEYYMTVLTNSNVCMKDYLSIIDKFGNKSERKLSQRIRRTELRYLKKLPQAKRHELKRLRENRGSIIAMAIQSKLTSI